MTRDYENFDRYLNELQGDVYPQPSDPGHTEWAQWLFDNWISKIQGAKNLLDVGCGDGFCQPMAARLGLVWTGVTIGPEYVDLKNKGLDVINSDFSFLDKVPDKGYDIILARHVLEHSPFPLLTLMEWHRVGRNMLCVVLPQPEHYTYVGRNHYAVMPYEQLIWLAARAGWKPVWESLTEDEIRLMFQKSKDKQIE